MQVNKNNVFSSSVVCLFVVGFLHVTDGKEWCDLGVTDIMA